MGGFCWLFPERGGEISEKGERAFSWESFLTDSEGDSHFSAVRSVVSFPKFG